MSPRVFRVFRRRYNCNTCPAENHSVSKKKVLHRLVAPELFTLDLNNFVVNRSDYGVQAKTANRTIYFVLA